MSKYIVVGILTEATQAFIEGDNPDQVSDKYMRRFKKGDLLGFPSDSKMKILVNELDEMGNPIERHVFDISFIDKKK